MKHEVLLLGVARERAAAERIEIEIALDATVADLRTELARLSPPIAELLPSCAIAIEHRYRADEDLLGADPVEIAVVPPVSGG